MYNWDYFIVTSHMEGHVLTYYLISSRFLYLKDVPYQTISYDCECALP